MPEASPADVSAAPSRVAQHAASQAPQRERECQARRQSVRFVHQHASSCRAGAKCLGVSPRTLAVWRRQAEQGELRPRVRGRPPLEPSPPQRLEVRLLLDELGPGLGLPTLQVAAPHTPRSVLAYLQAEHRRQFQQEHRLVVETLHWQRPGAVWAIDHSQPPQPVDGCYGQVLAVRDLASGMQLAWTAVPDATAAEALSLLAGLVRQHGPPLVLKSDNGSAFISHAFHEALDGWRITPLFSPPRMPRYNGACEAGIGAARRRTEYLADRQGRCGEWTSDDLYAAWQWANCNHYPHGRSRGTPAQRFAERLLITDSERDTFQAAVVQCEQHLQRKLCTGDPSPTDPCSATVHRRAVRQVLVELGYLDITRRSIPQPIPPARRARIT